MDRGNQSSVKEVSVRQHYTENYENTSNIVFISGQGPSSNLIIVEVQIVCLIRHQK